MKRDAVITCLLFANVCLLINVSVLLWQKPSIHDIDARIEYWHDYYEVNRRHIGSPETRAPATLSGIEPANDVSATSPTEKERGGRSEIEPANEHLDPS
jgi:hypothetical protein